jgi:hypothetical protein
MAARYDGAPFLPECSMNAMPRVLPLCALVLLSCSATTALAQSASGGQADRRGQFLERVKAADTDGDHRLSKAEMGKGMPRLADRFDQIDADHDGYVAMDELRTWMQARKAAKAGGNRNPGA